MTTAIGMLQVAGLVVTTLFARAALVVAVVVVLSMPIVLFVYTVRAIEGAWHRRHGPRHARLHA
jgi:hypothetical protein